MLCLILIIERKELVSMMKDHESSICSISIHASGRHALTTANEIAQIWDLDTFTKKKTLNGAQTVGIQQVIFMQYATEFQRKYQRIDSLPRW